MPINLEFWRRWGIGIEKTKFGSGCRLDRIIYIPILRSAGGATQEQEREYFKQVSGHVSRV
ncbi:MAG: hypothetical protein ACT4NX_04730 [Deltaproteobacteria bacterium]